MIGCVNKHEQGSKQVSRNPCFMLDYSRHVGIQNIISRPCRHVCPCVASWANVSPHCRHVLTCHVIFSIDLTFVVIVKVCRQRRKQSYCLNIPVRLDCSHFMLHCLCSIYRASTLIVAMAITYTSQQLRQLCQRSTQLLMLVTRGI